MRPWSRETILRERVAESLAFSLTSMGVRMWLLRGRREGDRRLDCVG